MQILVTEEFEKRYKSLALVIKKKSRKTRRTL